jgi:pyruvate,water dikinase
MLKVLDIPVMLKKTDRLKGEIANPGIIKAKARVIHWDRYYKKGMKNMKKGELLIVTQTKPDFMEAIRKASGIITNEGGLVSHAAIISRELGLPCLINTLHATEVFKTGDNLVLDCNKGEVYKDDN